MATIREQIARHTRAEATTQQQPVADDPLAPKPIRFTHQRGVDGVLHRRTVNGPTAGWHLEDGSEGSDAEPQPPPRGRGQTRDYQQQARVTQAYLPDYEDADEPSTRPPRSAMRYQHTRPAQYRGQTVLPTPPQRLRRQRLTGNAPGQQQHPPTRRRKHWSVYLVTGMATMTALVIGLYSLGSWWQHVQDDMCRMTGPMACLGRIRPMLSLGTIMTHEPTQAISWPSTCAARSRCLNCPQATRPRCGSSSAQRFQGTVQTR